MSRTAFLGKGVNNPEESLNIDNTYLHVIYKLNHSNYLFTCLFSGFSIRMWELILFVLI